MLEKIFDLKANKTDVRTELVAGVTTFLAMAYILAVNPLILSNAGMDTGAVFVATCLSAAIGTYIMAFVANLPIAQAPGMGMNAFFAFTVVLGMGYSWQAALAGIFCSGILFLFLSFSGIREKIITAIPHSLKIAVGVGIGFFIAFIGLKNAGIVVGNPDTLVSFGNVADPQVLLAIFGLVVTLLLMMLKQRFAIFIGMILTAIVGLAFGLSDMPTMIVSMPPSIMPTLGQVLTGFGEIFQPGFFVVIFAFLFVDFFDTAGTLMAVASRAGLLTADGQIKNGSKAMISDALSTTIGAVLGTSSV
ncbi:MAG: NCS2 family permease, partial [Culicoidibacterales bacterium]